MPAGRKIAHGFTLGNYSLIIILALLELPLFALQLLFQGLSFFFHYLNIKFFAVSTVFSSHFISLFFIQRFSIFISIFTYTYYRLNGSHTFNSIYVFIFLASSESQWIYGFTTFSCILFVANRFVCKMIMVLWV